MAYIYIVRCDDDSLYTGITKDIEKRMNNHAHGGGPSHAKYMRSHKPVELAALWQTEDYKTAARLEYAIKKKLTRQQKLALIANPEKVGEVFGHLSEYEFVLVKGIKLEDIINE